MTSTTRPSLRYAWPAFALGVLGGTVGGLMLLSYAGILVVALMAIVGGVSVRPGPFGAAGLFVGWGTTWLLLLVAAAGRCDPSSCGETNVTPWVVAGISLVAVGVALLVAALRQTSRWTRR